MGDGLGLAGSDMPAAMPYLSNVAVNHAGGGAKKIG
jgi:hypothetical protein